MNVIKEKILNKVNDLINKRKLELLEQLPSIHEIDDGIIIRFFTDWDNCKDNNNIKYKKVNNLDNPNEKVFFFYLPKDTYFTMKKRKYISNITCLNGKLKLDFNKTSRYLQNYDKIRLDVDEFQGKALENTYVITTNNI